MRADEALRRIRIWEDGLWRASVALVGPVPGFVVLESKRHIDTLTGLDGEEAVTVGTAIGRVGRALSTCTGCDLVFLYSFGKRVQHLHFGLAPHYDGDYLRGSDEQLRDHAPAPNEDDAIAIADRARRLLTTGT